MAKTAVKLTLELEYLNSAPFLSFIDTSNDVAIGVGESGTTYPTGCAILDKAGVLAYAQELDGRIPIQIQEPFTDSDLTIRMTDVTDSQLETMVDDFYTYHGLS